MSQEEHALRRQESLDKKKEAASKLLHSEDLAKHKKEEAEAHKRAVRVLDDDRSNSAKLEHYNSVEKKLNHAQENREQKLNEVKQVASHDHSLSNAERKNIVKQQMEVKILEEQMSEPTKENPPMKNVL